MDSIKPKTNLSLRLVFLLLPIVFAAAAAYSYYSYNTMNAMHSRFAFENTQIYARLLGAAIPVDNLQTYIDKLQNDPGFKARQLEFHDQTKSMRALVANKASQADAVLEYGKKMRRFHAETDRFKDKAYYRNLAELKQFAKKHKIEHIYIYADTGVDSMYSVIFDSGDTVEAPWSDVSRRYDLDNNSLGTLLGAEDIEPEGNRTLRNGRQMETPMLYSSALHGKGYYTYAPILDKTAQAVALVKVEVSLESVRERIHKAIMRNVVAFTAITSAVLLVMFLVTRFLIFKPLGLLTKTASSLAKGDIYTSVPPELLALPDEIGSLAKSVHAMNAVYQAMINDTAAVFKAVRGGRLRARFEEGNFKGDISRLIWRINGTLNAVTHYLDSMRDCLVIRGSEQGYAFMNQHFTDLFGNGGVITLPAEHTLPHGERRVGEAAEAAGETEDRVYSDIVLLPLPSGKEDWFTLVSREIRIEPGRKPQILTILSGVGELMLEKENAQKAEKAKSEFLSHMSHELRTPLNAIIGLTSLALKNEGKGGEWRFKAINSASTQLMRIINDVLDIAAIETGETGSTEEYFSLAEMLDDCGRIFSGQATDAGLSLSISRDRDIPEKLLGDSAHLRQVLFNLTGNAIKFTKPGGWVQITAKLLHSGNARVEIGFSVKDSGIGISEKFLRDIFTPFSQEDSELQRNHAGSGLGLPICNRLVALMGGELHVSSAIGQGSVFSFELSFAKPEKETDEEENQAGLEPGSLGGMSVLLVDDVEINRMILAELLEPSGINIVEAEDGAEAVDIFSRSLENTFSLIFMDIQMPGLNGYDATKRIRGLNRADAATVPIFALTANALKQDVDRALGSGMNGHLAKPVDLTACARILLQCRQQRTNNRDNA